MVRWTASRSNLDAARSARKGARSGTYLATCPRMSSGTEGPLPMFGSVAAARLPESMESPIEVVEKQSPAALACWRHRFCIRIDCASHREGGIEKQAG